MQSCAVDRQTEYFMNPFRSVSVLKDAWGHVWEGQKRRSQGSAAAVTGLRLFSLTFNRAHFNVTESCRTWCCSTLFKQRVGRGGSEGCFCLSSWEFTGRDSASSNVWIGAHCPTKSAPTTLMTSFHITTVSLARGGERDGRRACAKAASRAWDSVRLRATVS